jgi:hypothetical protein
MRYGVMNQFSPRCEGSDAFLALCGHGDDAHSQQHCCFDYVHGSVSANCLVLICSKSSV